MTKQTTAQRELPFVSVIVPVFNDQQRIKTCIEALLQQTYPRNCYEIIVVDNGSTDSTVAAIRTYPVTLLVENSKRGSYAARNKGLTEAHGQVIAFTDSDCTPGPTWLAEGVQALHNQQADLVGGNVRFVFSPHPTGAEICDSIANMQIEQNVRERGVAKTANLFVRAQVFEKVGSFPAELESGGDVIWTGRATASGFKLIYAPAAEVAHPTRRLGALLKKHYRVGKGQHAIRATSRAGASQASTEPRRPQPKGKRLLNKTLRTLRGFLPDSVASVQQSMQRHRLRTSSATVLRVWFAGWLCRAATTLGSLSQFKAR